MMDNMKKYIKEVNAKTFENSKYAQNNAQFLCTYFSTKGCNRLYTILRKC